MLFSPPGEKPVPVQEGDPLNGIEFLAMNRAMLRYVRKHFERFPIPNDPQVQEHKTLASLSDWLFPDRTATVSCRKCGVCGLT